MSVQSTRFSLLIVDDDPSVVSVLRHIFHKEKYNISSAESGQNALALLNARRVDAAIIDLKMPGMDGITLLKEIRKIYPDIMVVMLTGHGGIKEAVEAIKLGADDFLEKPLNSAHLRARMAQLFRIWELKVENRDLKTQMATRFDFDPLVGNSTVMLAFKQLITQVGPTEASILIQGETGAGKELVARALHAHSPRSDNNFIPVDCASISENVMESELFGHVKGAFTGAHTEHSGLIRTADRGTLFLDEVGELSANIQAKLLRVLQEREVRPVGSSKRYPVNVRIIVATNRNLEEEVLKGLFREDLFFRLNVVALKVPPLRERIQDISLLAWYFINRFKNEFSPVKGISQEALTRLENYKWPGNVRELENVINRAIALGKHEEILCEDLPQNIYSIPGNADGFIDQQFDDSMASYEKAAIQNALEKSAGNRQQASRILGIGEATLYRKIKKHNLTRKYPLHLSK